MIGFFIKSGDVLMTQSILPYINQFDKILKDNIKDNKYGQGLDVLLIEYHLEGEFLKIPDKQYKFVSYRKKEKSVSAAVYVPKSFQQITELEKRELIIKTTTNAVLLIKDKIGTKDYINFNFEKLLSDLEKSSNTFLSEAA